MANFTPSAISQLSYQNTFGDWLTVTQNLVTIANNFTSSPFIKPTGTLILADPTTGLVVNAAATFGGTLTVSGIGSSVTIQNNLTVQTGQIYFQNTVLGLTNSGQMNVGGIILALAPNTGLAVSNTANVGLNLNVGGNTNTALATLTNTLMVFNAATVNSLQSNLVVNTATVSVTGNVFTNILRANTLVNVPTMNVTGITYSPLIQANTSINVALLLANTIQSNTIVNLNTIITNSFQANTTFVANSYTNALVANTIITTPILIANTFQINGATIYNANTFTLSANTLVPLTSYFRVYRAGGANANAAIRWNETGGAYWDLLDLTLGFQRILTLANISSSLVSSGNTAFATSLGAANTLNTAIQTANTYQTNQFNAGVFPGNITVNAGNISIGAGTLTANQGAVGSAGVFITIGSIDTVVVQDTGSNGSNIKLIGNGVTTPNKTIRAWSGNFQILNSAYSSAIFNMDDAGDLSLAGTLNINGQFNGTALITANGALAIYASGGAGQYASMLQFTNNSPGALNINKNIRLNPSGGIEIINSVYNNIIFSLTDAGNLSVPGTITAPNLSGLASTATIANSLNPSNSYFMTNLSVSASIVATQIAANTGGPVGSTVIVTGDISHTGYIGFFAASNGNRQGYIGYSSSTGVGDSGAIPFVAGSVAFGNDAGSVIPVTIGGNLVLHAGNFNSYSPTLTGSGASGSWHINANSVTTVYQTGNQYWDVALTNGNFIYYGAMAYNPGTNTLAVGGISVTGYIQSVQGGSGTAAGFFSTGSIATVFVQDTGVNGGNIKITGNGATTPSKFIRVNGGVLQFINNAYSNSIWQCDDSGSVINYNNLQVNGAFSVVGPSMSINSDGGYIQVANGTLYLAQNGNGGYPNLIQLTNNSPGALNINKNIRLNPSGGIEIINSAYNSLCMVY